MQIIDLQLPVNSNWTIWVLYTVLQQVNGQSDQQCEFLGVRTALSRGTLTVVGMVQKLGSIRGC